MCSLSHPSGARSQQSPHIGRRPRREQRLHICGGPRSEQGPDVRRCPRGQDGSYGRGGYFLDGRLLEYLALEDGRHLSVGHSARLGLGGGSRYNNYKRDNVNLCKVLTDIQSYILKKYR